MEQENLLEQDIFMEHLNSLLKEETFKFTIERGNIKIHYGKKEHLNSLLGEGKFKFTMEKGSI